MNISVRIPDILIEALDSLPGKNRSQKIINCLHVVLDHYENDAINVAYLAEEIKKKTEVGS